MLESLNAMLCSSDQEKIKALDEKVLENVIEPSLVWKIGAPNSKIRKAGLICFQKLLKQRSIRKEILINRFKEYLPLLKTCSDDD